MGNLFIRYRTQECQCHAPDLPCLNFRGSFLGFFFSLSWPAAPISVLEYSVWGFEGMKQHIFYKNKKGNCSAANLRFDINFLQKLLNIFYAFQTDFRRFQCSSFDLIYCSIWIIFSVNVPCGYTKRITRANLSRTA